MIVAFGRIENGVLTIHGRKAMEESIRCEKDTDVVVEITKKKKSRSIQQNRYLWGCVYPSLQYAIKQRGFNVSIEQVHDLCKFKFMKVEMVNESTGEVFEVIGSTSKLSTVAFSEYVENIRLYAAEEFQTEIPEPNEQSKINI